MSHVKLTLSCPGGVGEQVVEALLESTELPGGFISFPASGHGHTFSGATLHEKVRGRTDITIITAILPVDDTGALLAKLRDRFPTPHLAYWTEAVHSFGDFG